jgi:hypothetical protein
MTDWKGTNGSQHISVFPHSRFFIGGYLRTLHQHMGSEFEERNLALFLSHAYMGYHTPCGHQVEGSRFCRAKARWIPSKDRNTTAVRIFDNDGTTWSRSGTGPRTRAFLQRREQKWL